MGDKQKHLLVKRQYPLSRDFRASARLQVQHLLWNIRLGYLLHPSIPVASFPSMRIADIGTGNALWPLELSRHLPSTAQIFGYDISPAQFPAKEWLPQNVQLDILDVLNREVPKELKDAFDVVHIRAFAVVIKGGDPKGVLNTLVEMLKPGGYLQWDEIDVGSYEAHSPNATISKVASQGMVEQVLAYLDDCGFKFDWTHNLSHLFATSDLLSANEAIELPFDDAWLKFETDDHLMGLEEILEDMIQHSISKTAGRNGNDTFGQVEAEEVRRDLNTLLQSAVGEAGKGACLRMRWYSCLGRKRS